MSNPSNARRFLTAGLGALTITVMCLAVTPTVTGATAPTQPAAHVDPLIGTALADDDFPGADTPFGMVQWSPDTTPSRPDGGGYAYGDPLISGFSLTHLSGPGCASAGDIPILPTTGAVSRPQQTSVMPSEPYSHIGEVASPGYYAVSTGVPAVRTELTVTPRSGLARLTFPETSQANVMVNLGGSAMPVSSATGMVVDNDQMVGAVTVGGHGHGFCGANDEYTIYFWLQFSRPFAAFGSWNGATVSPQSGEANGPLSGLYATFDATDAPVVLVKAGISYVSAANAELNAESEDPGWDFDAVRSAAYGLWNADLNRIQVSGGTARDTTVFYTGLYHSLLHPNIFSDVNGQYIGFDDKIHAVPSGHAQYANFSGWDIYRSQVQLLTLVAPDVASDIATSMLNDAAQSGVLPKWALNNGESYIMVGDSADPILADLAAFGAQFDVSQALTDMVHEATVPSNIRPGLSEYEALHYEPNDGHYGCCNWYGSVSTTLEYTTDDESIAQLAAASGDPSEAAEFMSRAQDWEYLFNPATGFMEPKDTDGEFPGVFFPENPDGFVEANAFEYSADVPYNLRALIAGGGGDAKFIAYLNQMVLPFIGPGAPAGQPSDFALQVGGIKTAYATPFSWQGNEPALEIPWEYDYAGAPYETQAIVRNVSQSLFTPGPNGLPGNDDLGEMSSWLVWSDLGLYPETPGSAYLALGSPLFTHEVIDLPSGHTLTIDAPGASDSTPYVQSMTFNAQPWSEAFLPPSVLGSGGQLNVNLGTTPNQRWASAPEETPPSWSLGELPAIGSTSTAEVPSWPTGVPVHLNAQNVSGQDQTIRWVARTTSGVTVTPTSGTFTVPAQGSGGCIVMVRAAAASTTGTIRFTLQTATSQVLPQVAVEVAPATNELAIGVRSQDLGDDLGL